MRDAKASLAARNHGIQAISKDCGMMWIDQAIRWAARNYRFVTSDRAWEYLEAIGIVSLHKPNLMGAAFVRAHADGVIKPTNRVQKSARVAAHHRQIQVWQSTIYRGAKA